MSGCNPPRAFPLQEECSNLHYEDSLQWDPFPDDNDDEESLVGTEGNPNYPPLTSNLLLQEDSDVSDDSVDESDESVDDKYIAMTSG